MSEKAIVHKVPEDVRKQSIESLKVRKKTLEYLRQNGFKTIDDVVERQMEIPSEYRGNIYAYLIFGMED
jgi:N-acetylglutamate synthase-like GNAT family acetyltransferase